MIDTHYDLLTICYLCYLKNDYTKIIDISKEFQNNGVRAVFANLYFMTKEEMIEELDDKYYQESVSVLKMFTIAKEILENFLPNIEFIYSIEGCDFVKENELEDLYDAGLRSIILVWNHENQYGSGFRSDKGLTDLGRSFLEKAIDLGIGIDLSHANEKTFFDIIELLDARQKEGKEIICYASHSNARQLCDRNRNLTDEQLLELKKVGGLVGVFSNRNFITNSYQISKNEQKKMYLKHICYIAKIIGTDKVMLSTDDMRFCGDVDNEYLELPIYSYATITSEIQETLSFSFSEEEVKNILYRNAEENIMKRLIKKEKRNIYDRY